MIAPGPPLKDRIATLRRLFAPNGDTLDRALVVRFFAPRSFTGEEMAELHVTGGRAVLSGVLDALGAIPGLRPAEPGEFAWRAFEHGKLDLSEVEGLGELVAAETAAQRRQALRLAEGQLSREADLIRSMILRAMSLLEAEIDFSDVEEASGASLHAVREVVGAALGRITDMLRTAGTAERLRDGLTIVISGPPNVGKSTLMNTLAKRDVSIVSAIPGTTRDLIEVYLDLDGYPVKLIDTAGLRDANDPVEQIGVQRARNAAARADLTLWLYTGETASSPPSESAAPVIIVRTKSDLPGSSIEVPDIAVSATTGSGISDLIAQLTQFARNEFIDSDSALVATARQRKAFVDAREALVRITGSQIEDIELVAEDLRLAGRAMGRISGRIDVEDVLGDIFSRLCIGK